MKISVVAGALSFFLAPVMSVAGVSAEASGRLSLYDDEGEPFAFENGNSPRLASPQPTTPPKNGPAASPPTRTGSNGATAE